MEVPSVPAKERAWTVGMFFVRDRVVPNTIEVFDNASPELLCIPAFEDEGDEWPWVIVGVVLFIASSYLVKVKSEEGGLGQTPPTKVDFPLSAHDLLHQKEAIKDLHGFSCRG